MADFKATKSSSPAVHIKAHFKHRNQIVQIRRVGFETQPTFEDLKKWLDIVLKELEQQLKPSFEQHYHRAHHIHNHPLSFLLGGHPHHFHQQRAQQQGETKYAMNHKLFYVDNEHEWIQFGSELEWKEAVSLALKLNGGVIHLLVQTSFDEIPQPQPVTSVASVEKKQAASGWKEKPKSKPERKQFRLQIDVPQSNNSARRNNIRVIPIVDAVEAVVASQSPKAPRVESPKLVASAPSAIEQQQAEQNLSSSQLIDLVPAAEKVQTASDIFEQVYPSVPVAVEKHQDEKILDESWDYLEVKSDNASSSKQAETLFPAAPVASAVSDAVIVNSPVVEQPAKVESPKVGPAASEQQQDFTRELNVLESMGFSQKQLNLHLLRHHKGNLQSVVLALIDFNQHAK